MTDSAGLISFSLGSGVRSFPSSGTAATFANVFNNATTSYSCQTPGIYTPAANDNRKVVMQFQDSNGWQTLPAMIINAVPYAMYAWKADNATLLNGKADTAFVQYSTIPTCTSSQALQYNGASFQCITAGGGTSYTITANDVTNALGYTPVNPTSYTTVTSTVNSLGSSVTTLASQVNNLSASNTTFATTINSLAASMAAVTSSQWVTSGSAISYVGGNVGLGTSAPASTLHVEGSAQLSAESGIAALLIRSGNTGGLDPQIVFRTSHGTLTAPTSLSLGDSVGGFYAAPHNGSSYAHNAFIGFVTDTASQGTAITLKAGSGGVRPERVRISSSGNVGVGVSSPITRLDVAGGLRIGMESASCAVSYAGTLRYSSGAVQFCNGTAWTALSAASSGSLQMSAGTVSSPGISVNGDSDTGIYSSGANSISLVTSGSAGVTLSNDTVDLVGAVQVDPWTMYSQVPMQINGTGQDPGYSFANGPSMFSPAVNVLALATNGSERLRINSLGNVGIGTSAPTGRLNIVKASADTSQANAAVNIGSTANPTSLSMGMYDSNYAWIQTFATPLYINALGNNTIFNRDGGNVGIGVEAPVAKLQVSGEFSAGSTQTLQGSASNKRFLIGDNNSYLNSGGGSNKAYIFGDGNTINTGGSGSNNIFVLGQGISTTSSRIAMGIGAEQFTVLPSGNVGVGATNPGAKLEVGGQIKITGGSPAAGRFLASDASGLGTWTALTSNTITTALGYTPVASGSISGSKWTNITGGINYGSGYVGINAPTLKVPLSVNYDTNVYNASYLDIPTYAGAVIVASGPAETAANVTKPVLVLARQNQSSWLSVARFELGRHAVNGSANTQMNIKLSQSGISNEGDNAPVVMTLLATGNVGIGDTTPTSKLTVAGTVESSTGGFKFPDGSTQTTAGGPITWFANSNNNALVSSGTPGGVVIGRGAGASSVNLWVTTNWNGNDPAPSNTGTYNLGVGAGALALNTSGSYNTSVGNTSAVYNTTGQGNTALGALALQGLNGGTNTGSFNTALGYRALMSQASGTAGSRNIAIGYQAGQSISTGSNNVILGSNTGSSIATLSNNIIIADGSGNDRIHVDSSGNVGIGGTATPGTSLEVKARSATGGVNMVMVTDPVLTLNKASAGDSSAIRFSNNGTMVWALGDLYGTSFNLWNAAASTYNFTVTASGNVGIANSSPSYKLDVSGDLRITGTPYRNGGDSAWIVPSDERLKDVSGKYNRGLREITNIETIYFNYKKDNPKQIDSSVTYTGVLAQEVQKQIPEAVKEDKDGFLSLNTTPIFWTMVNAIKELYVMVTGQDRELAAVKEEVVELRKENTALKTYLCDKDPSAPICK